MHIPHIHRFPKKYTLVRFRKYPYFHLRYFGTIFNKLNILQYVTDIINELNIIDGEKYFNCINPRQRE